MTDYIEIYKDIIQNYELGSVSSEKIGLVIAQLASVFCNYNLDRANSLRLYRKKAAEIEKTVDENGKAISSAKAKILSDATDEASKYGEADAHVENLNQLINSLKKLQEGIIEEHSHSNLV